MGFIFKRNKSQTSVIKARPIVDTLKKIPEKVKVIKPNKLTISPKVSESTIKKTLIKRIALANTEDFLILRQNLADGVIMIANMEPLVADSPDPTMVHNKINWLKQYCVLNGGSVAKLKDHLFIITPNSHIKIENHRELKTE